MYQDLTEEQRKQFARDQINFLKDQGITDGLRLSRIFKAAGPGQIQAAWTLVEQAETQSQKDLLDCILTGVNGANDNLGWDRMKEVLLEAGFEPPEASSERTFFRILDGAMEILVPDSYEFTKEEIRAIHQGLKNKHRTRGSACESHYLEHSDN
jgi:hypothetical protein